MSQVPARDDTIELREITGAVWRGRRWLVAGVVTGLLLALLVNWLGPRRYEGTTTVVVRDRSQSPASSGMSLMSGALEEVGEMFSMGEELATGVETELAILESRDLLERAITATGLQVRITRPRGAGVDSLFSAANVRPRFDDEIPFRFERERDGQTFVVTGPDGFEATVAPGGTVSVPGAELTLRDDSLPDEFGIELMDRQDLVDEIRLWRKLSVDQEGGDVAELNFYGQGPRTSARMANTLATLYLSDRRERSDSLHREQLGLITGIADSVRTELDRTSEELRTFQERAGSFEPERLGDVERAAELSAELDALQVEAGTLDRILERAEGDSLSVSDFLSFPSFLETNAVNTLLQQLLNLRGRRRELRQRRTEEDPEVRVLTENIEGIEEQLISMGRSYRETVGRQTAQIRDELEAYERLLQARPGMVADSILLLSEIERTGASYVGVQAQAVQARLGHIGEGADLRQVDRAIPPKKASFPRPLLNLGIGGVGGLLFGLAAALTGGFLSTRIDDPRRIAARTGLHSFRLDTDGPLLPAGLEGARCVLVLGVAGARAEPVARRLAEGAALRDGRVAMADLTNGGLPPHGDAAPAGREVERVTVEGGAVYDRRLPVPTDGDSGDGGLPASVRRQLEELESGYSLVVVALPDADAPVSIALLQGERPVLLVVDENAPALDQIATLSSTLERAGCRPAGVAVVPA